MKPSRIEELLASRPPDEGDYRGRLDLDAARQGARRPAGLGRASLVGALGATTLVAVVVGLVIGHLVANPTVGPAQSPSATPSATAATGVIPWTDTSPSPAPTPEATPEPQSLPACKAADMALLAGGWGGATGSLEGEALVVKVSGSACRVGGTPAVALLDAAGTVIASSRPAAPVAAANSLPMVPGGVAIAGIAWSNWCGAAPRLPLQLRLSLPDGGGQLAATVVEQGQSPPGILPRCDAPVAPSSVGPRPFAAPDAASDGENAQPCRASQLSAFLGQSGAAAGTLVANLVVVNFQGPAYPCRLPGTPRLELRDATGRLVAATKAEGADSTVVLPTGWAAAASIGLSNFCSPKPASPLRLDLVIGSTRVDVTALAEIPWPGCMAASQPPAFGYASGLAIPAAPAPPSPDSGDSLPGSVTLSPLPTTRPGGVMEYTVTLTYRPSYPKPINFGVLCPNYIQRLFLPDRRMVETRLALNCGPVGRLAPGASVTFAMRLTVPSDAPPGPATLVWVLGDRGPSAKATLQIAP